MIKNFIQIGETPSTNTASGAAGWDMAVVT